MIKKNILFVGAHIDDIELGCAGTIVKFSKKNNIYFLIITNSEFYNQNNKIVRKKEIAEKELNNSLNILKVKKIFNFNLNTNNIQFNDDTKKEYLKIINKIKPETVFVHSGNDTHLDHQIVSNFITSMSKKINNIIHYKSNFYHYSKKFNPNLYIDISKEFDTKIKSIKCYKTELKRVKKSWLKLIKLENSLYGNIANTKYAEAFEIIKIVKKKANEI